jgi:hypothetical protein
MTRRKHVQSEEMWPTGILCKECGHEMEMQDDGVIIEYKGYFPNKDDADIPSRYYVCPGCGRTLLVDIYCNISDCLGTAL